MVHRLTFDTCFCGVKNISGGDLLSSRRRCVRLSVSGEFIKHLSTLTELLTVQRATITIAEQFAIIYTDR